MLWDPPVKVTGANHQPYAFRGNLYFAPFGLGEKFTEVEIEYPNKKKNAKKMNLNIFHIASPIDAILTILIVVKKTLGFFDIKKDAVKAASFFY